MKINPNVIQMFMTKTGARWYAWRARRKGYKTMIQWCTARHKEGSYEWGRIALGTRWAVRLDKDNEIEA